MQSHPNNAHHCCLGDALLCPGSDKPRPWDAGRVWRLRRHDRMSEAAPGGVAADALLFLHSGAVDGHPVGVCHQRLHPVDKVSDEDCQMFLSG